MFKQNCASMLYAVHVICILQQPPRVPCLTIDNRLTHAVNDCYSRISIGSKVPDVNSTLRLGVASLTECEENCSKRGNNCVTFSFGVGTKGNSTCLIGVQIPALEYLEVHPEYDVYVKKRQGSPWCDIDHLISVPRYTPLPSSREERILSGDYSREPLGLVPIENERTTWTKSSALDCHRKTQASKKATDLFIERIVSCENVQDCCQACNYERSFVCKAFNHRRGTDDSECTCELTSKPYFRMNVATDFLNDPRYDYYEKTANCPASSRHADDLLNRWNYMKHYSQGDRRTFSALERVGKDIFRDRTTATNHVYSYDHQRNNEESFDVASRSNALSWNRDWNGAGTRYSALGNENIVSSRNENHDKEYLESNLGYDRPTHESSPIPNKHEHFYQQLYTYDDTFDQRTNSERQQGSRPSRRCSVKAVSGTRLNRGVVRKTCMARDFSECEHFCTRETSFSCESFAYRYRVIATNPANNCLLSDHSYRDLNFYTDLEPDRDYDSYVIASDADMCDVEKSTSRYPSEECFSRIRSGFTIPMVVTKTSLFVDSLGDCQFACTRSEEFACKCFVYKYAPAIRARGNEDASSNCFLTDRSPEQINPVDMPDMDDAELYERSTFPYGCDFYPPPISFPNLITRNGERDSRTRMDEFCYSEHHAPCKLTAHAVTFSMRTIRKSECRQKCSTMRRTDTIPCMSFDYANAAPADTDGTQDNCFLTDISVRDLRPNLDYVHDHDHRLYMWNDYDPRCNFNAPDGAANVTPTFHDHANPSEISNSGPRTVASPLDPSTDSKTNFGDEQFHEGGPKYVPVNEEDAPLFESADNGRNEHNIFYSRVQHSSLRRYTVSGHPCKNGTVCQRNRITSFWSCETENTHGAWDYCCEPNHQCGYSKGYHRPWCYVGSDENQWRPCSDTYYPYHIPKDRSSYPRSALYSGRHWPVIYFHRTSPPNSSTDDPYREASPPFL